MKKVCFLLIVLFVITLKVNGQFGPEIASFDLQVPQNYNKGDQVDTSGKKARLEKTTYSYNQNLTSDNFKKITDNLVPGKTYTVKIFPAEELVTSSQCLSFLRSHDAILVGPQGTTLVYDLAKNKLPKGKCIVSFAPRDELFVDSYGNHLVPLIQAYTEGDYAFELFPMEYDWIKEKNYALLCFMNFVKQ